jgi:hypothetical protein
LPLRSSGSFVAFSRVYRVSHQGFRKKNKIRREEGRSKKKKEFEFEFLVYGPINHVRLKLDHCPPNVNTAQNAATKWIKLKVSSQAVTLQ